MNRRFAAGITPAVAILILIFLTGCGNSPPQLKQLNQQLNIRRNPETTVTRAEILLYFQADDDDGEDDIEALYLINDGEQLLWRADRDNWSVRNFEGARWTGAERFMLPGGEIPRVGEYRVVITDRAGERVDSAVFIPLVKAFPDAELFPQIIAGEDDLLTVDSPSDKNVISFYDSEGFLLGSFSVGTGSLRVTELDNGSQIFSGYRSLEIGYYDNSLGAGIISGPYRRIIE